MDRMTREVIARALTDEAVCERLRADPEAATLFRRLVRQPRIVKLKRNSTLSEFHDVGLLLAMIPEFRPVVGRVHHDIYHVYTVDVHSIAAVTAQAPTYGVDLKGLTGKMQEQVKKKVEDAVDGLLKGTTKPEDLKREGQELLKGLFGR
jgi:hypothetical protein